MNRPNHRKPTNRQNKSAEIRNPTNRQNKSAKSAEFGRRFGGWVAQWNCVQHWRSRPCIGKLTWEPYAGHKALHTFKFTWGAYAGLDIGPQSTTKTTQIKVTHLQNKADSTSKEQLPHADSGSGEKGCGGGSWRRAMWPDGAVCDSVASALPVWIVSFDRERL